MQSSERNGSDHLQPCPVLSSESTLLETLEIVRVNDFIAKYSALVNNVLNLKAFCIEHSNNVLESLRYESFHIDVTNFEANFT